MLTPDKLRTAAKCANLTGYHYLAEDLHIEAARLERQRADGLLGTVLDGFCVTRSDGGWETLRTLLGEAVHQGRLRALEPSVGHSRLFYLAPLERPKPRKPRATGPFHHEGSAAGTAPADEHFRQFVGYGNQPWDAPLPKANALILQLQNGQGF